MGRKTFIRVLALAAMVAAVVTPIATYGRGWDGPRQEAQTEALVALGTAFTFQGSLSDGGSPATGTYDFKFILMDALAGGAQVGPDQVVGDVAVSGGLFTVTLNFGDVFHGNQYFLEIYVRPGASAGAYTTLAPRQPISAVPNASYALESGSTKAIQGYAVQAAAPLNGQVLMFDGTQWVPGALLGGGFSVPLSESAASSGALFTLTNTGVATGSSAIVGKTNSTSSNVAAIIGQVTSASPGGSSTGVRGINNGTGGSGIGVWGTQDGSGWGVFGEAPSGIGVYGHSASGSGIFGSSTSGTGGFFSSTTGSALHVNGKIEVGGSAPAAFQWTVTAPSLDCIGNFCTNIDNPATNGYPDAILIVTHRYVSYNNSPIGVNYTGGKWRIYNEDTSVPIAVGAKFNVLVIHP